MGRQKQPEYAKARFRADCGEHVGISGHLIFGWFPRHQFPPASILP
jgi:hypothetical protein